MLLETFCFLLIWVAKGVVYKWEVKVIKQMILVLLSIYLPKHNSKNIVSSETFCLIKAYV